MQSTDIAISIKSCWGGGGGDGGPTRVEEVGRVKGSGRAPPPSASLAENTIITESM
jgi:hypothetical protein